MQLREFVEESIKDIVLGIENSRVLVEKGKGGKVSPNVIADETKMMTITFDVAVTVKEESSGSKGAGIKVWGASVGGSRDSTHSQDTVSRIQFGVPILLRESKANPYE